MNENRKLDILKGSIIKSLMVKGIKRNRGSKKRKGATPCSNLC